MNNIYTRIDPREFEVSEAIKLLNYNLDYVYELAQNLEKGNATSITNIIPYTDFSIISNLKYWGTLDNSSKVFFQDNSLKVTSNSNNISLVSPIFSEKVESFQKYTLVIKSKTDNKEPLYINNAYILHEDNSKTRLKVYTEVTNKEFTEYSLIFENDVDIINGRLILISNNVPQDNTCTFKYEDNLNKNFFNELGYIKSSYNLDTVFKDNKEISYRLIDTIKYYFAINQRDKLEEIEKNKVEDGDVKIIPSIYDKDRKYKLISNLEQFVYTELKLDHKEDIQEELKIIAYYYNNSKIKGAFPILYNSNNYSLLSTMYVHRIVNKYITLYGDLEIEDINSKKVTLATIQHDIETFINTYKKDILSEYIKGGFVYIESDTEKTYNLEFRYVSEDNTLSSTYVSLISMYDLMRLFVYLPLSTEEYHQKIVDMYNHNIPNTINLRGEAVGNYNVDVLYYIHFYKVISDSSYKNEYLNLILEHKQSNGLYKTDNESTSKEYSNSQYLDSLLNNTEIHQDYSIYFQAISIGKGVNTSIVNKIDSNYNSIIEQIRNVKVNIDEDSILAIAQERFIEKTYYKEQLQSIYSAIKEASVEVNMDSIIAQVVGSKQFVNLTDNVNVVKELVQENKSSLEMLDDKIEMSVQESKLQVYLAQSTSLGINLVQNSCFLRGLDNFTLQGPTGQIVETTQGRVYYKILTSQVFSLRQEIPYNLYEGDYAVGLDVYGSGSITINIYNSDSNSLISSDVISPELATPKRYYTTFKIKDITKVDLEIYTENADLSFGYIKLSRGTEDYGWTLSSDDTNYLSEEIKTYYEKVIKYYTNVVIGEDINSVINNLELKCKQLSAITNVTLTHPILKASTVLANTSEYLSLFIDSYTDLINYLRTSEDKDYLNDKTSIFYKSFTKLVNNLVVIIDYIANYDTSKSNSVYIEAIQQDILDVNTNMENLNTNLIEFFQDGILTSEEKSVLRNNVSVLEREKAELDVRVAYYTTQNTIKDSEDVQLLSEYHNNYNTVYQDIITLINDILDKDEITQDMRYEFNAKYEVYKQHAKVLQEQLLKVVSKYTSTQTQLEIKKVEEKIKDLNSDLDTLKGLVGDVSSDGILTTLEKRSLKNQLQEITHAYLNIKAEIDYYQSQDILKGTSEISSLNSLETQLDSSYNTVKAEIDRLLTGNTITEEDVVRVDGYINNVSSKLQDLQSAISNCLLKVTALETSKEINSLNTQINGIQGSVDSLVNFTNEAWLDGILSYTEAISQLDLVNRIKLQIQVFLDRVDTLLVNDFIKNNTTLVEKLGNAKRDVDTTFNTMEATINNASSDGTITEEEKTQFNTALSNFYSKLNYLRSVISEAESIIIQGESNAAYEKSKKYIDDNYQDVKDTVDKMNTFADEAWVDGIITKAETVTFTNLLDNLYKESLDMKKQCEVYTSAVLTPELQGTSELGKLATALSSYESEYNKFYTAVEEIANFPGVTSKDKTDYNNSKNDYEEALVKLVQVLLECSKKVSEVKTNKALGFTDKDGNTTTVVDWVKNADIELTKEKIKMYVENTSTVLVTSTFIEENYLTKSELENTYATKSQISMLDSQISLSVKSSEMESYKQEFLTESNSYTDTKVANANNTNTKSLDIYFYLSTSPTELIGGSWSTTAPEWIDGKYMWQKVVTTLGNGATRESQPTCISGAQGPQGISGTKGSDGQSVDKVVEEYVLGDNADTPPTSGWSTVCPVWEPGKYLWSRLRLEYKNPAKTEYAGYYVDTSWQVVNEIKIGGRNLLLKSGNFKDNTGSWISNGGTVALDNDVKYANYTSIKIVGSTGAMYQSFIQLKPNTTYVYSVLAKASKVVNGSNLTPLHMWMSAGENSEHLENVISHNSSIGTTWTKAWVVFKTPNEASVYYMKPFIYNIGDATVWLVNAKVEEGNKATDWTPAPEDTETYVDVAICTLQNDLEAQIDNKIETYNQTSDPSSAWTTTEDKTKHTGDLWYNGTDTKRWSGSSWISTTDKSLQSLANSKAQVFTSQPTIPYYKGDLWITALDGTGIVRTCKTTRTSGSYTSSDWIEGLKYTDDSKANEVNNNLVNNYVTVQNFNSGIDITKQNILSSVSQEYATKSSVTDLSNNLTNNYSTTSAMNSAIDQKANEITSLVSNTYTTKAEFNNLSIGGRNFVKNSNFAKDSLHWPLSWATSISDTVLHNGHKSLRISASGQENVGWYGCTQTVLTDIKPNTTITISCWYYVEDKSIFDANFGFELKGRREGGDQVFIGVEVNPNEMENGVWKKIVATSTTDCHWDSLYIYPWVAKNGTIYITDLKVEYGNKATDWTPAPEDIDDSIAVVDNKFVNYSTTSQMNSAIEQKSNEINLNVSNTYATKTSVTDLSNNLSNNYSTTQQMNSAIDIAKSGIKLDVSQNYASKHEVAHYFEGENKWKLDVYSLGSMSASAYPTKETMIQNNCQYQRSYLVEHPSYQGDNYGDNYVGYATTYMHFTEAYQWTGRVVTDDNGSVYLNDVLVLNTESCQYKDITLNFTSGWNKVEVLYAEGGGGDGWQFDPEIIVVPGGVMDKMNCYGQNSTEEYIKANYSTTQQMNSSIEQKANEITSSVSNIYSTKSETINQINNIKVGGTNFINNGRFKNCVNDSVGSIPGWIANNVKVWYTNGQTGYNLYGCLYFLKEPQDGGACYLFQDIDINTIGKGVPVTLSFDLYKEGNVASVACRIEYINSSYDSIIEQISLNNNDYGGHRSYTFTTTSNNDVRYLRVVFEYVSVNGATGGYLATVGNVKLEKGNKETDWCPSEHDIQSQLDDKQNQLNDKQNQINNLQGQINDTNNNISNNYASKSELSQTTNSITAKFTESGGYNLLINSGFKNGLNYWEINQYNNPQNGVCEVWGFDNNWGFPDSDVNCCVIRISNQSDIEYGIRQTFKTTIGKKYTVSFYYASHRMSNAYMVIRKPNGNWLTSKSFNPSEKSGGHADVNNWGILTHTFTATDYTHSFEVNVNSTQDNGHMWIAKPMICEGELLCPYSPHPSEIYDGSTKIDKDGVTVYSSSSNFYSNISSDGLNIYTKGDTTLVASFRSSGAFVDNLTVNTLNCEGLPQRASLRGIKKDYYVNTTYSGNALGEDTNNYSNSIQSILDRIKASSIIIDIDITIHIAQGAIIDEAIEFKDFLGNGTVTLYWGYNSKFIGTLKTSNTTVKLCYIGENNGTFPEELMYSGGIGEDEVLARHRVYLPIDTPNRFIIQSYFETQYCIFIRKDQTYKYYDTVTTNDYVFNVSNNGCVVSYRCDYVYHFCICYGTGAFTGYFGDNTGSIKYTHSGLRNNIRGVITESLYTSKPYNYFTENFGDIVEVLTPDSPIKRESLYSYYGGPTELNLGSSSPGTSDTGTSSDYKIYNLRAEYQKILSTDTHTAYQSPGCIIGAVAGAEYTSILFVPSSFVDDSHSLLESNKVISEIQISLKRSTSSYNKEYGVDFNIELGSYRAYMGVNIKEKQTCTVSLPTNMVNFVNNQIAKPGNYSLDLDLRPVTYAESGYAEFYSNEIYLYVTYKNK